MKKILLILLLCLQAFNTGCGLFEIDKDKQQKEKAVVVVDVKLTDVQKNIVTALAGAKKEDVETIYKVFAGVAMYVDNSTKLTKFSEVLKLIADVEDDYQWKTDTYGQLTDIVETDLTNRGYSEDKELDEKTKKEVIGFFKEYADAILIVLKSKGE